MHNKESASIHTQTALLNSLILEWEIEIQNKKNLIIPISPQQVLRIPIAHYSQLGRHQYRGKFFINDAEIDFHEALELLIGKIAREKNISKENTIDFIQRVKDSESNITQILERRGLELNQLPQNFITAEQMLFAGHSLHPTPKGREEFNEWDFIHYSPETKGEFSLSWFEVSSEIFYEKQSRFFNDKEWLFKLFQNDLPGTTIAPGWLPFPMHPWQEKFILELTEIKDYILEGKIRKIGSAKNKWTPTSSLRTLYFKDSEYMLKFSMNVKLTNSIRHLLTRELDRGLQVHEVFNHPKGLEYSAQFPEFSVIHEPVYAGLKGHDGTPLKETLFLARFNPFRKEETAFVLAALTQNHTTFSEAPLTKIIHSLADQENLEVKAAGFLWFKEFLRVAIRPLILAQANFGFLLGSHQQNMIIGLDNFRPVRSYFRDCNGTGFSHLGKNNFSSEIELITEMNGNILPQEVTHYLFGYYVVINSVLGVMSAVTRLNTIAEQDLIQVFQNFLFDLKEENPQDRSFIDYLLHNKELMHKGNFFCTLKKVNENTQENPLAIYVSIPNPFYHEGLPMILEPVTYTPLSLNELFTVSLNNGICEISTSDGKKSYSKIEIQDRKLFIQPEDKSETLLAIQAEFLLGHLNDIQDVEVSGMKAFSRSEFYQRPLLWHHSKEYSCPPEIWTETHGRRHPIRPIPYQGEVYRRYVPSLKKTISFRLITISDLDTFHHWHNQPRVAHFWELNASKEELRSYIEKGLADPHQIPMMVEIDGEPVGYFEMYWVREDRLGPYYDSDIYDRGFHFLIGNRNFLGFKFTDTITKSALHLLYLDEARTKRVMAEPRHDNQKVLKYAEASIGWKKVKTFDFPHKRAVLLENSREAFFQGNAL